MAADCSSTGRLTSMPGRSEVCSTRCRQMPIPAVRPMSESLCWLAAQTCDTLYALQRYVVTCNFQTASCDGLEDCCTCMPWSALWGLPTPDRRLSMGMVGSGAT